MVHTQPSKHILDHADYTAPTRQHELNDTDQEIDVPWKICITTESINCPKC